MEENKYYCPQCKKTVKVIAACGSTNYFCDHCKRLISSKQVLTEEHITSSQTQENH
jgi:molybdenum cofactor biosynthesis enzyme MoaA